MDGVSGDLYGAAMTFNWADGPAWAALPVSLVALGVAWRGQHRANQSASKSAEAAVRSAAAAEQALALQQQQVAAAAAAAAPRPKLVIEHGSKDAYYLRNVGSALAVDIEFDTSRVPDFADDLPGVITLEPGEGQLMILSGSLAVRLPTSLPVRWQGQNDYQMLPMPPR